jgi:hypothetical protein
VCVCVCLYFSFVCVNVCVCVCVIVYLYAWICLCVHDNYSEATLFVFLRVRMPLTAHSLRLQKRLCSINCFLIVNFFKADIFLGLDFNHQNILLIGELLSFENYTTNEIFNTNCHVYFLPICNISLTGPQHIGFRNAHSPINQFLCRCNTQTMHASQ